MSDLTLLLLGSPRIERHGVERTVGTRKTIALVAYLAVTGTPQRRELLAALLWPESDQASARASLRYSLSSLKKAIGGEYLQADRETIALVGDNELWIDITHFRSGLAECRTHAHAPNEVCPACVEPLTDAAALYRGDFLAGFTLPDSAEFDEWQFFETESLRRDMSDVLERLVRVHADADEYDEAIDYAHRLVALDPLHEPAHRQLMHLYALVGRRAAALRQYQECVRILEDELGVAPAPETTALYERIQAGDLRPSREVSGIQTPRHNLPERLTSFVGREEELATIAGRLRDEGCRLLTLLGPGGIGKTRLAIEAARHLLGDYSDGVFFVSLAPLSAADELVPAIAGAVGFSFHGGERSPKEQLLRYLRGKDILLILDNFEHLRAGAGLLVELMRETRDLALLVTSRERLTLQAEWVLPVDGLHVGGVETSDASAIRLFLDRSRQAQPSAGDETDVTAVAEICRLVDGMPLAIELAAAWTSVLSPADIAAELAESLDLLATTAPDVPARHQSMRAVFDTMWRRLTEPEQRTLRQFSVFRGGCDREAAEQVASATLPILMALVHKSVLRRDADSGRFEIHELLRQYAAEQLDTAVEEREAVQERHARYYTTFVHRRDSDLKGTRQIKEALAEIEVEYDNVRTAWAWALARRRSAYLDRSLWGLGRFYYRRWRIQEGESLFREAADRLEATNESETRVLATALLWHGILASELGDTEVASRQWQQSLDVLDMLPQPDADPTRASVLRLMGATTEPSDREEARDLLTRSLTLYQRHGDHYGAAFAMRGLGFLTWNVGRYDEAETFLREALSTSEEIGDELGLAEALSHLAFISRHRGEIEAAEQMQRRSLAIFQQAGDRRSVFDYEGYLALTLIWQGQFSEARQLLKRLLSTYEEMGWSEGISNALVWLGMATEHLGEYEAARTFLQDSLSPSEARDDRRGVGQAYENLGAVALVEEHYADAAQMLQRALGLYRDITQRACEGTTLAKLAFVARAAGDRRQALRHVVEALHIANDIRDVAPLFDALPAAALLFADQVEPERAMEFYALASHRFGIVRNSRWFAEVAGRHIGAVQATLPADVVTAAEERGRTRDLWESVKELLVELRQRA